MKLDNRDLALLSEEFGRQRKLSIGEGTCGVKRKLEGILIEINAKASRMARRDQTQIQTQTQEKKW